MNIHEEKEIIGKIINEDGRQSSKARILASFASSMARSYQQDAETLAKTWSGKMSDGRKAPPVRSDKFYVRRFYDEEDLDNYFNDNYDIIKIAYPEYIDDYEALEKKYNPGDNPPEQLNEGSLRLYLLKQDDGYFLKNMRNQSSAVQDEAGITQTLRDLEATGFDTQGGLYKSDLMSPEQLVATVGKLMPELIPIKVNSEKLRRAGISFKE